MTKQSSNSHEIASSKTPRNDNAWVAYGVYGAVGFQLASCVVGGLYVGHLLDEKLGTNPWLGLSGLVLGAIGGFYNLFRIMTWKSKKDI